jgi:L-threonylcarbamoyladenylate synthase
VKTHLIAVNPKMPEPEVIQQAVEALRRGGLVAFPTDTLYALGADALALEAIERVLTTKGRHHGKPLSVLIATVAAAEGLTFHLSDGVRNLMQTFWPGPLTIVVKASAKLPATLVGPTGTIGLRLPGGVVAHAVLAAFGGPIIGTSANKTGGADPADAKSVQRAIGGQIDLILDGGRVSLGVPSTVIDCTAAPARILREGAIPRSKLSGAIGLA